eukprot:15073855-Alexandrium_andersonii.AAC.1
MDALEACLEKVCDITDNMFTYHYSDPEADKLKIYLKASIKKNLLVKNMQADPSSNACIPEHFEPIASYDLQIQDGRTACAFLQKDPISSDCPL